MLTIKYCDRRGTCTQGVWDQVLLETTWRVGEPNPTIAHAVVSVVADGEELGHIALKFRSGLGAQAFTIPWALGTRTLRWYGDHAKFIVGNLA